MSIFLTLEIATVVLLEVDQTIKRQCSVFLDILSNNILFRIEDSFIFLQIEEDEMMRPIARKAQGDCQISLTATAS